MKYCIDSCSLIELTDLYRPSVFPKIFESLDILIKESKLHSAYEVYEELKRQEEDTVYKWVNDRKTMFILPSHEIQVAVKDLLKKYPRLVNYRTGKSGADPWIICTAIKYGLIVVTEEQYSGDIISPKIPDVCRVESIRCIKLIEMLEEEGIRYS
jgi:hypothetical protein